MLNISKANKENFLQPVNFCDGANAGKDFGVHPGEMMSVRITSYCSERCPFCIAAEDMKNKKEVNIPNIIKTVKKERPKSLSIIGGEPLLFLDNCVELVEGAKNVIKSSFITTSIPYTLKTHWKKFEKLMSYEMTQLTVSIQSLRWETNNKLMNSRRMDYNRIEILEKILNNYGDRVLVVVNLMKGGIDSKEEIDFSLDTLYSLGATRVRLNELQSAPAFYVNFEEIMNERFLSPYAFGCKSKLPKLYPGLDILLKRSCFLVEKSLGATKEDIEKLEHKIDNPKLYAWAESGVIYEDGSCENYWLTARDDGAVSIPDENEPILIGMPKIRKF